MLFCASPPSGDTAGASTLRERARGVVGSAREGDLRSGCPPQRPNGRTPPAGPEAVQVVLDRPRGAG
ncbi:hypothetical protein predicted by Glimmer/Critica [Sorangium cellulosum So ce56]|uniref:Uncharacterized protein n=1 Tax=Sorangium cellulosum (strain So ce56) TaxID=448385 RepID=A9GE02_SORC5|nr:hypothetical protein predicted by Glimmer/Critica [Sorangium cellulosum So ce56]